MKQTRTEPASDPFAALKLMVDVASGSVAGFISPPEINGVPAQFDPVPETVSDQVALIVESSGSTGRPKRIELSLDALLASADASATRLGGHGQWLLTLPANYIAGANVLFRSVIADTQPVIMNSRVPFSAEGFRNSANLMQHQNRYTSLVPTQLDRLAAADDPTVLAALRSFRAILVGGQAPNSESVSRLRELGVNIVESYGMAETCGGCVYDGIPFDGVELEIESGRVAISGPILAEGLGGRYLTEDLGVIENGNLRVSGRADRVIISGGLKANLDDVESKLSALTGVQEVIAVGLESQWGQSVGLVICSANELDLGTINQELEPQQRVIKVVRVENIPRLFSGKPDYQAAQELLAD